MLSCCNKRVHTSKSCIQLKQSMVLLVIASVVFLEDNTRSNIPVSHFRWIISTIESSTLQKLVRKRVILLKSDKRPKIERENTRKFTRSKHVRSSRNGFNLEPLPCVENVCVSVFFFRNQQLLASISWDLSLNPSKYPLSAVSAD